MTSLSRILCFVPPRKRGFLAKTAVGALLFWLLLFLYLGRTSKNNYENDDEEQRHLVKFTAPPIPPQPDKNAAAGGGSDNDEEGEVEGAGGKGRNSVNKREAFANKNKMTTRPRKNKPKARDSGGDSRVDAMPATFFPPVKESWFKTHPMDGIIPNLEILRGSDFEADPKHEEDRDPRSPGAQGGSVEIVKESLSPEDRKAFDDGWQNNAFNQFASDKISVHRSLPDVRDDECKSKRYRPNRQLPKTSIILCFHN